MTGFHRIGAHGFSHQTGSMEGVVFHVWFGNSTHGAIEHDAVDLNRKLTFNKPGAIVIAVGVNFYKTFYIYRFGKFSASRSFPTFLASKSKKYKLDTNLHGGNRAFVMTGEMERVFPFDIYPMQLIKAIMIEDIDAMENLGIYEVDEEDFALAEYIDTSKTEIQTIVRKGLDIMRKEMS